MRSSQRPGPVDPAAFLRALDEAAAHVAAGRLDAAAQVYRRLERQAPDDVRAAYSLATIDIRQGRLDRARRRLEAVVAREPGLVAAWHNLGAVRQGLGDWDAAAEAYGRALALRPEAADTRAVLAVALAALGRGGEAIDHHRVLARDPARRWPSLSRIALIDPAAITDEERRAMQAAAADEGEAAETRIGLCFALGEVLEARGRDGEAFDAYAAGNRLKRATLPAAEVASANAAAAGYVRDAIGPQFLAAHAAHGDRSAAPIFVVGMPRSGSTLIEQMLASHPDVQGLGETGVLSALTVHGYPESAVGLKALAAGYLVGLRERGWDGASRFVDKTLENYLHVGLITVLFPRAVILHAVREPMDVCFACYRQLFASGNETLYDLEDIAAEYHRYSGLMTHWAAVVPGRVTDVAYETLVADPEGGARALLEAARLSWDPAVLRFHERPGAVRTASASQVRRPIYRTSVARWRRHADRLRPLAQALGVEAEE